MNLYFRYILYSFFLGACSDNASKRVGSPAETEIPESRVREQFVRANQAQVQKENDEINYYIRTHRLPFVTTTSGIRYYVYNPSLKGDSITDGMEITVDYIVSMLDGTSVYTSEIEGSKTIKVGQADVESGIHRGVKYLKKGDKALLIIPSAQAHGLLGDMKKIPPRMPIVYDLRIHP